MQLGLLAFLGAFAGFYLGLAAYLILRNLFRVPLERLRKHMGTHRKELTTDEEKKKSHSHL